MSPTLDPNNPIDRSIQAKQRGDLAGALAELDIAIRDGVDPGRAYYQRGLTLDELGRTDDAIAAYQSAIELRPDYAKALVNLARIHMARQNAAAAAPLLARAEPLVKPDDAVFLVNRAQLRRMTGKLGPAIADAERAAQLASSEAGVWVELGLCYLMDPRKTEESIKASRRAVELDPSHAGAAHNLAAALDRSGDHAAALPLVSRAVDTDSANLTFAQTKACVLLHLDRPGDAMPLLELVERGRPDDFEAQYNLACGLARTGHADRAVDHVRRAIGLVPPQHQKAFIAHIPNDPDLAALRALPAFRALQMSKD